MHDVERCVLDPARQRGEISGDIPSSIARLFFILIRDQALFGPYDDRGSSWIVDEIILPLLLARTQP
jgi:hypothetical protein